MGIAQRRFLPVDKEIEMALRSAVVVCSLLLTYAVTEPQQNGQDELLQTTRTWLQHASKGNRGGLNAIMDPNLIATTPVGDVVEKEQLVPDDPGEDVSTLPSLNLEGPVVRLYGDTALVMGRLTPSAGTAQAMNGTFVYNRRGGAWRLVGIHLSRQK
jgi:hypothetical protein